MKNSVNEIAKFTSLANSWWDEAGSYKILHQINPLRLEYILSSINSHFKNKDYSLIKITDLGCGGGLISIPLARLGMNVTAIDGGAENIAAAKAKAESEGLDINFIIKNLENLQEGISAEKNDVIICLEVLEHLDNPGVIFENAAKMLKDEGMLIVSTLNKNIKSKLLGVYAAEYILGLVPKGTHDYEKFLTPADLRSYALAQGMKLNSLSGMKFNIFTGKWVLSNDIDVNYFAIFSLIN